MTYLSQQRSFLAQILIYLLKTTAATSVLSAVKVKPVPTACFHPLAGKLGRLAVLFYRAQRSDQKHFLRSMEKI